MKRDVVTAARGAAAALSFIDLVFAVLLARRARVVDWACGESEGIWRFWGIGDLFGYTGAQAMTAAKPTPANLRVFAMLRGQLVPAHAVRALRAPDRRGQSVVAATLNGLTALLAWRASAVTTT